jgi:hypothetical protein
MRDAAPRPHQFRMWQPTRVVDAIDYAANNSVGLIATSNRTVIIEPEATSSAQWASCVLRLLYKYSIAFRRGSPRSNRVPSFTSAPSSPTRNR